MVAADAVVIARAPRVHEKTAHVLDCFFFVSSTLGAAQPPGRSDPDRGCGRSSPWGGVEVEKDIGRGREGRGRRRPKTLCGHTGALWISCFTITGAASFYDRAINQCLTRAPVGKRKEKSLKTH